MAGNAADPTLLRADPKTVFRSIVCNPVGCAGTVAPMARQYGFRIVNVFTRDGAVLSGNPLCVFEDARGLQGKDMQALAQQLNLSESTFIFPSTRVDATVRIYTPAFEMPFAGHPTLGTAHVLRALTGRSELTLDMHAGDINVVATGPQHWRLQTAGKLVATAPVATIAQLATMLQVPAQVLDPRACWINTGSEQLLLHVVSVEAVLRAAPLPALLAQHATSALRTEPIVYVWAWADAAQTQVVARTFFMAHGAVIEDPATGSACANLGGWLLHTGDAARATGHAAGHGSGQRTPRHIVVRQGDGIGRPSTLHLSIDEAGAIFVSGEVIEVARGTFAL